MPEYLAPGVFMEEVSYRSKSIEGVSTTTTGFVGPTRYGPVAGVPPLVTSYAEFEATYGDDADVAGERNYLALGGPGVLRAGRQAAVRQPRRGREQRGLVAQAHRARRARRCSRLATPAGTGT